MHNHDDKYQNRSEFEPGTSMLQAPVDTNEPLGPAILQYTCKEKIALKIIDFISDLFLEL